MFSKWIIDLKGFENYRIGEDKEIYRLPYTSGKRSYSLRQLKFNPDTNRWMINGKPWTRANLRPHLVLDPNPIQLTKTDDLPF